MATTPWTSDDGRDAAAPRIWAVAGGKGGVGKSVVSANLAAAMAAAGRRCAVVDVDLGGANLHTLLGARRPRHSLSQLLTGDVASLADLMVQTSVPNLWLVSGHGALLEMANPRHAEKEKVLRGIRELDVDEVVLDLAAGSAFNVLDFFLLARRGIVVVTPEPTAVENAEQFLRAAFYRSLREVARRPDVAAAIRRLRENGRSRRVHSASELIALVRAIDPPAAKPLEDRARAFAPLLLVNQLRAPDQRGVGPRLVSTCRERLGIAVELVATIETDPSVAAAVAQGQPALQAFPLCLFSQRIEALAQRLQQMDPDVAPGSEEAWSGVRREAPAGAFAPAPCDDFPSDEPPRLRPLPPLDASHPGAHLRACRQGLGLSLAEMAARTRIRILDAIENERFELLPPEPYLRGYLLEYARELGVVEIGPLVTAYLARCPVPEVDPSPREAPAASTPRIRLRPWRR
jgi:flagellar biosynthesis protein FlhG